MASTNMPSLEESTIGVMPPESINNESKPAASLFSDKIEEQCIGTTTGDKSDSNFVVSWDGPLDPKNPVNFPLPLKIINTGLVALMFCLDFSAASAVAPCLSHILSDFKSENYSLATLIITINLLGLGFGPFIMAPLSEVIGRVPVYNVAIIGFTLSNIGCAKSTSLNMLLAFRFFSGLFVSVTETNGRATIADLFVQSQRDMVMSLYSFGPIVAGVVSPVFGGFITAGLGWRWVFYFVAILSGVFGTLSMIFLRETYAPVILKKKAALLQEKTKNPRYRSEFDNNTSTREIFILATARPLKLLFLSPVILSTASFTGLIYGYQSLMFTSYSTIFEVEYNFSLGAISLSFLGCGFGSILSILIFDIQSRRLYRLQKTGASDSSDPERRLDGLIWIYLLTPIGLLLYGWTAQRRLHWILPIIASGMISFSALNVYLCILMYIIDCFPLYVASASTGVGFLVCCITLLMPLAGPPLFQSLRVGWGCSLLALTSFLLLPIPLVIMKYGAILRKKFVIKSL